VTLAFILVIGLGVASAVPRPAVAPVLPSATVPGGRPAYIPVRDRPAVAGEGRRWAGSTTSVIQPALPSGPAAVTR
jgi:hypothetical protein